jgi:hypothetical protein
MKRAMLFGLGLLACARLPAIDLDEAALVQGPLTEVAHWAEVPAGEYDYVLQPGLPIRRLVLAARAPGAWLVCYEQGGIGLSFEMVLVPFESGSVRGQPSWFGLNPPYPTNLQSLRAAVREHRHTRLE